MYSIVAEDMEDALPRLLAQWPTATKFTFRPIAGAPFNVHEVFPDDWSPEFFRQYFRVSCWQRIKNRLFRKKSQHNPRRG